jgi:hypothetical protein
MDLHHHWREPVEAVSCDGNACRRFAQAMQRVRHALTRLDIGE